MCDYCKKGNKLTLNFNEAVVTKREDFVLTLRIEENTVFILANLGFMNKKGILDYTSTLSTIRISYCPECGRRLGE